MPRFPRLVVPNYPHHVTQRGVRKQTTFFNDRDYRNYLELALALKRDWPIAFWAYCLMPNHVHAVVVPRESDTLSRYYAQLHRRYARRTNAREEWVGHLWQKRFYSVVMDEAHAIAAMRYVERNPVRAGLCEKPEDWPWSSARGNLELEIDPLIDRAETKAIVSDWAAYLGTVDGPDQLDRIRNQTRTGRPDGGDRFLDDVERRTNRRVRKKRAGRRRK